MSDATDNRFYREKERHEHKYMEALRLLKEAHYLAGKSMGDAWYNAATALLSAPSAGGECKEVEVIDPYVMDLVRQHGSTMTNAEIVQRFLPKERLSIQSATEPSDSARLLWLETLLKHCPHAELTWNDDEDEGPLGWRLLVESCSKLDLRAPTLEALIDLGIKAAPDEDGDVIASVGPGGERG